METEEAVNADDFPRYRYGATLVEVVDGDTVRLSLSVGLGVYVTPPAGFRIVGYNAPERYAPGGDAATERLAGLLIGRPLYVETIKPPKAEHEQQSFARWLCRLWIAAPDTRELVNVSDVMTADGFDRPRSSAMEER